MKYYYNGKLIRTSKREYTHAIINKEDGGLYGCRKNYDLAKKFKDGEINQCRKYIEECKQAICTLKNGKTKMRVRVNNNYSFIYKLSGKELTLEYWEKKIEHLTKEMKELNEKMIIVELEARV